MTTLIKKNQPKSDYLITNRRKDEANRQIVEEKTRYYARMDLKSQFESNTTTKINNNHFLSRLNKLKEQEAEKLHARQQRLKLLYEQDQIHYKDLLKKSEGTNESRINVMRERMNHLRAEREKERQAIVKEKRDLQWRQGCDELRKYESKMLVQKVTKGRSIQLEEKEKQRQLDRQEKLYYEALWEQGRLQKVEREKQDHDMRHQRNMETLKSLNEQLAALKAQARSHEALKAEEARLMQEDTKMRLIEDERLREEKEKEKRAIRFELDTFNKAKILQRQQEIKEELERDIKTLQEFSKFEMEEKDSHARRRQELQKEMQLYREHLAQQKEIEEAREREIERYYSEAQERVWKVRTEKWKKERAARDRLMKEVISGRQLQLQEAIERNRQSLEESKRQQLEIEKQIEKTKLLENQESARKLKLRQEYSQILAQQIQDIEKAKEQERIDKQAKYAQEKVDYLAYEKLLQEGLERARIKFEV
ncbi:tumor suppressor, Mitostatin-domain-containing protein [Globomyces pollinis-pini]|nr:tumor suppressor, Mitostatin-domain-containing protein [Globomyces pollinis-pini]